MSTKYKLILPLILCCKFIFAQTATCGTPGIDPDILVTMPYYANNAFLDEVIALTNANEPSKKSSSNQTHRNQVFNIPVKVWVFHDNNGTNGALTNPEVEELITRVNQFHEDNHTRIRFYLKCAVSHINSSANNLITNKQDFDNTLDARDEPRAMDWFFVEDIDWVNDNGIRVGGAAYYPWQERKFKYAIETGGGLNDWLVASTVHEVGHNLGLAHTFDGKRGDQFFNGDITNNTKQELVSRSAEIVIKKYIAGIKISEKRHKVCELNGDAICDTEANPRALANFTNLIDCNYVGETNPSTGLRERERDLSGWRFHPQEQNFMAYTPTACRSEFTPAQVAIMQSNIMKYMTNVWGTEKWYNRNTIILFSDIEAGKTETVYSSENIISFPSESLFVSVKNGGTANLIAQSSILLKPGFEVKNGGTLSAKIESIHNCNLVDRHQLVRKSNVQKKDLIYYEDASNGVSTQHQQLLKDNEKTDHADITVIEELNTNITAKSQKSDRFKIYPNPSSNYLSIEFDEIITNKITISDKSGRLINTYTSTTNPLKIDISNLKTGMYFINIYQKDGTLTKHFKIIKE